MGQLQAGARIALDYPERFSRFYSFLTSTDIAEDTAYSQLADTTATKAGAKSDKDRELWKSHAVKLRQHDPTKAAALAPSDRKDVSDAAQARARLASLVARKLDGFQLRTQFWWDRLNQALGLVVGIAVVWYALGGIQSLGSFERLALGIVGGLLAPFAKDFSKSLASFASK